MRRVALLALLVVLAGCSVGGPGSPTESGEQTDSTPTATQTSTDTPAPTVTPTPRVNPSTVITFEDLPEASQEAFLTTRLANGLAEFVPESPYIAGDTFPPEAAAPFAEHEYVRKNGTLFELSLEQGELYASYQIRATRGAPGPNATVASLENISADRRDAVRAAIENGSYTAELGRWRSLGIDAEYVRYEGATYRLRFVVGDYWAQVLRVEQV